MNIPNKNKEIQNKLGFTTTNIPSGVRRNSVRRGSHPVRRGGHFYRKFQKIHFSGFIFQILYRRSADKGGHLTPLIPPLRTLLIITSPIIRFILTSVLYIEVETYHNSTFLQILSCQER